MSSRSFNLVTDPWIKVIDKVTNQEIKVSLIVLFENSQNYSCLAGEMKSQDLSILRFLLAILTTVYSRFNVEDEPYEWLKIDEDTLSIIGSVDEDEYEQSDLQDTWKQLFKQGHFSKVVTRYLKNYQDRFDLFGEKPFYQVTADEYDDMVPEKKKIETGSGTVAVKQINRLISESNNTPNVFTPKTENEKNCISIDELVRWLIMYQNFTGVTDKTKILTVEKFSNPSGWLYNLNPVYVHGNTIFETLMLNLVLFDEKEYILQKPVWEYANVQDYVSMRKKRLLPDDLSSLYTTWSRLLYIEWGDQEQPIIFSAGLPMFSNKNAFIEPMTTWKSDLKGNSKDFKPAVKSIRSLGISMWRNFGQYVNVSKSESHEPGIVTWLHTLEKKGMIEPTKQLNLATAVLINDGNTASQSPISEIADNLVIKAEVLFDIKETHRWPERIENIIDMTQQIGKDYWQFVSKIGKIRNINSDQFANQYSAKFYNRLNDPFKQWLSGLSNDDDRNEKEIEWKMFLRKIVLQATEELMNFSTSRDISGKKDEQNIQNVFIANNYLRYNLKQHLNL